eukprot:m.302488 g.302488  ORF g.302488 m.302488 type:complete len:64 (-) comp16309_c0_seq44:3890-4081(-)
MKVTSPVDPVRRYLRREQTDGTEPSHMHTRDDLNCTRGYEWLFKRASLRKKVMLTEKAFAGGL